MAKQATWLWQQEVLAEGIDGVRPHLSRENSHRGSSGRSYSGIGSSCAELRRVVIRTRGVLEFIEELESADTYRTEENGWSLLSGFTGRIKAPRHHSRSTCADAGGFGTRTIYYFQSLYFKIIVGASVRWVHCRDQEEVSNNNNFEKCLKELCLTIVPRAHLSTLTLPCPRFSEERNPKHLCVLECGFCLTSRHESICLRKKLYQICGTLLDAIRSCRTEFLFRNFCIKMY